MSRPKTDSAVLTLRVPARVHRYLTREARRQSLLVSKRRSEREALAFLDAVADRRGWK